VCSNELNNREPHPAVHTHALRMEDEVATDGGPNGNRRAQDKEMIARPVRYYRPCPFRVFSGHYRLSTSSEFGDSEFGVGCQECKVHDDRVAVAKLRFASQEPSHGVA